MSRLTLSSSEIGNACLLVVDLLKSLQLPSSQYELYNDRVYLFYHLLTRYTFLTFCFILKGSTAYFYEVLNLTCCRIMPACFKIILIDTCLDWEMKIAIRGFELDTDKVVA